MKSSNKQVTRVLKAARRAGWVVGRRGQHFRCTRADRVVIVSSTPSDGHGWKNAARDLGLPLEDV